MAQSEEGWKAADVLREESNPKTRLGVFYIARAARVPPASNALPGPAQLATTLSVPTPFSRLCPSPAKQPQSVYFAAAATAYKSKVLASRCHSPRLRTLRDMSALEEVISAKQTNRKPLEQQCRRRGRVYRVSAVLSQGARRPVRQTACYRHHRSPSTLAMDGPVTAILEKRVLGAALQTQVRHGASTWLAKEHVALPGGRFRSASPGVGIIDTMHLFPRNPPAPSRFRLRELPFAEHTRTLELSSTSVRHQGPDHISKWCAPSCAAR
ncbi:hypothetical protein PsYK624_165920 [Phanerochaete sordida]|uniref:Uncharacterized protein n=1 Tax=Phanerochaete sordida TaxID=48140 RepID=A0A9P3GSW7_9APHY|nr:hypothetical protein PsYK624_165920 [Phanerochaete sordida]